MSFRAGAGVGVGGIRPVAHGCWRDLGQCAAQDYERLMSDSQASRADKADSITSKEKAKADLNVSTENAKEQETSQEAPRVGGVRSF